MLGDALGRNVSELGGLKRDWAPMLGVIQTGAV